VLNADIDEEVKNLIILNVEGEIFIHNVHTGSLLYKVKEAPKDDSSEEEAHTHHSIENISITSVQFIPIIKAYRKYWFIGGSQNGVMVFFSFPHISKTIQEKEMF
jgi:hypothetical protein